MLEEKKQEVYLAEDQQGSTVSLADEKCNWSTEEVEVNTKIPSLLERINKTSIPTHLMPPSEPCGKVSTEDDNKGMIKVRPSPRQDSSPRMISPGDSHPRTSSNDSNTSTKNTVDHENTTSSHGNQPKIINLNSFENTLGEDSLISRILKSTSISQVKDKLENEDTNLSPLSSTPRSRGITDTDEIRHIRSSSGVSDSSYRSMSSMDTSQSFDSYKSQTSLDNVHDLPLDFDKNFRGNRQTGLNRTRSSSLNEQCSVIDPRLSISAEARSASFSGTTDGMVPYPTRSKMFRSDYCINSPSAHRGRLIGNSTEVMLLDNRTIVLKNLTKPEESSSFDVSYFDQMSVSDGLSSEAASVVSRNENGREIGSMDDATKEYLRKPCSRSVSSAGPSSTARGKRMKRSLTSMSIWSLESVPMSPTSLSDAEDTMHMYTSFRDAHGYSALSNLRRQRNFNRDIESRIGGFNQSFTIVG